MYKYSIIVPIYNIESYLGDCLESIIKQKYDNYEVILVDDGSRDKSKYICKNYCEKTSKFKYYYKKNGGLSDARNYGLNKATGDYIVFIDGDDFLEIDSLEEINKILIEYDDLDLFLGNYNSYYENNKKKIKNEFKFDNKYIYMSDSKTIIENLFSNNKSPVWSAWRLIVKNEFIKEKKLEFDKSIVGAEDCDWFFNCIINSKNIVAKDIPILNYRIGRIGSITSELKFSAIMGQLKVFNKWYAFFSQDCSNKSLIIQRYLSDKYINVLSVLNHLNNEDFLKIKNYIIANKNILYNASGKKQKLTVKIINILGIRVGTYLVGSIVKIKNIINN